MNPDQAHERIATLRASLREALPERDKEIDYVLAALLAGGHLLVEGYEGSGFTHMLQHLDAWIMGDDPDGQTRVDCHPDLEIEDVLPLLEHDDVLLFDHFNRASRRFQITLAQLLKDGEVVVREHSGKGLRPYKLAKTCLVVVAVNKHEGGTDVIPYEIADSFVFRLKFRPLTQKRELELLARLVCGDLPKPSNKLQLSEIEEWRSQASRHSILGDDWNRQMIDLAHRIGASDYTLFNGRPSLDAISQFKRASECLAYICGNATFTGEDARVELAKVGLSHRFPRKANCLLHGDEVVNELFRSLIRTEQGKAKVPTASAASVSAEVRTAWQTFRTIQEHVETRVFGRSTKEEGSADRMGTIDLILAALFAGGHVLLEDYPGSGKSFMVERLAEVFVDDIQEAGIDIERYRRIQCVPDLMPGDMTGYEALVGGQSIFRRGPIFAYFVLLDEINRTTPKVQAAMLEAMAEKQVTVGDKTYKLGDLFFVIATQNPLDAVGTYPLPAAQLDRFLFKRRLNPVGEEALEKIIFQGKDVCQPPEVKVRDIIKASEAIEKNVDSNRAGMAPFFNNLARAFKSKVGPDRELKEGSVPSPRSLHRLLKALKVIAFIDGKGDPSKMKVVPQLVPKVACDFFRHRIYSRDEEMGEEQRDELIRKIVIEALEAPKAQA